MELKLLMSMLRRRLWLIIAFVVLCTLGTGYYSKYYITPMYEATSTLIVNKSNLDREGIPVLDMNEINSNIMLINSYKVIVRSASIMDIVVQGNPELKATSEDLMDRIKIVTTQNSQIITLGIKDPSYEHAMQIVNAVSQVFKNEIPRIMKVDNITILDTAKPKDSPEAVSPNVLLNSVLAMIVSLMLVIGVVLLKEYLNDTVENEQDVEQYLGLTTLGTIRRMKKRDIRTRSRRRSKEQVGEKYASLSQ